MVVKNEQVKNKVYFNKMQREIMLVGAVQLKNIQGYNLIS